jgi:hypothetical protein
MADVMRPTQSHRPAGSRLVEPHKRLMAAVLQTVVDDCRGSVYRRSAGYGALTDLRSVRRATAYLASTDRTWPFSFENLCDALNLDAYRVRQELKRGPRCMTEAPQPAG